MAELKFVVDSSISLDELRYARRSSKIPRNKFERAFSFIKYDFTRIQSQAFVWPHPSYRLADIEEQGGICVDQAYYAAML
ncbi:MAG: hypothetical protein HC904_16525, partial [Blastochloris sp.]|nr:hypothetical protein [Blastochloris sp.]